MATAKEEFHKRVYLYSLEIVRFVQLLPSDATGAVLGKQLLRSGTSVTANVIEAKSASSKRDYINFYQHALKSANESKLWLCLIRDTILGKKENASILLKETVEMANILAASILTMKGKR